MEVLFWWLVKNRQYILELIINFKSLEWGNVAEWASEVISFFGFLLIYFQYEAFIEQFKLQGKQFKLQVEQFEEYKKKGSFKRC